MGRLMTELSLRDRAYFQARSATRSWGCLTAAARALPSFLIAGGQRCGTTSLFKAVRQHPNVLPPVLHKGVHFFDVNYDQGIDWYRGHFPLRATARRHGVAGRPALTGESSPYYLFHPQAASRISRTLPDVKVLVLVRDPVSRAHSAHAHEMARGFERLPFQEAIEREDERVAADLERMQADPTYESFDVQHHAYVARGRYADQIDRMASALSADQVLVIDSGRFFTDPEPQVARVFDFLGLPMVDGLAYEQHNARPRPKMDTKLQARLDAIFEDSDRELAGWLGAVPSWRE